MNLLKSISLLQLQKQNKMYNDNLIKNKKAQVGETMTWIVATVIILVVMFLFIFAVSLISPNKEAMFGLGNMVKDEGSILADQQITFAVQEKQVNGVSIKDMINQDEEKAKQEIEKILGEFKENGVDCKPSIKNKFLVLDCKNEK